MTGFSSSVRSLIRVRAQDHCEKCGERWGVEIHHRRPRGAGGSRRASTNAASNGLLLCRDCHTWIESNRTKALLDGWLLLQEVTDPSQAPVRYRGKYPVNLDDAGNVTSMEGISL